MGGIWDFTKFEKKANDYCAREWDNIMKDYHKEDSGWKNVMFPTEPASVKACPACHTPIRYVRRYGRIIKKGMQNKKFLLKYDSQLKKNR